MKYLMAAMLAAGAFAQTPAVKDQAWSLITGALTDKNPDTRLQAVQAMGLIGVHEPYLSAVEGMLEDKDIQVRVAAVQSLVDMKNKKTAPALKRALADPIPEVSFAAAKALYLIQDKDGEDALISILGKEIKTSSGYITKQMRDSLRLLQTPKPLLMLAFKTGIGFAPVPGLGEGVSSLQGILSDPGMSGRAATALLLAPDKDPRVEAALIDCLDDKEPSVRAAACHALALRNKKALEPKLVPLMDDKKPAVRLRAAAACLRLESLPAAAVVKKPPVKASAAPVKK